MLEMLFLFTSLYMFGTRGAIPKTAIGITGLNEISGRDYGIEEPYGGPSMYS